MESLLPPQSGQTQSGSRAATPSGGTIVYASEPAKKALQSGRPLEGRVVDQPQAGRVTIETPSGSVTVETKATLAKGSTLTVTAKGNSLDNQVRLAPHPSTPPPSSHVTAKPIQLPPQVSTALSTGQAVQAQVTGTNAQGQVTLQTAEGRSITLESQSPLPKGTTVTLTQSGSGSNAQIRVQPHPTPPAQAAQPTPPPSTTAKPVQLPPQISTALSTGQAVQAQVTGTNAQGQVTLQTAEGRSITLESQSPLPKGTTVTLTQSGSGSNAQIRVQPHPTPPAQAQAAQPTPPPSTTAKLVQLPPQISTALSNGQTVQAQVIDSAATGRLTLQTSQGIITLDTQASLPKGTPVTVTQPGGGANPVLTVQPQSNIPAATAATGTSGATITATTQHLPPQVSNLLTSGQPLQGQVTGSNGQGQITLQTPQGQITVNTAQPLPTGSTVTISLLANNGTITTLQLQPQAPPPLAGDATTVSTNLTLGTRFTATILAPQSSRAFPNAVNTGGAQTQSPPSGQNTATPSPGTGATQPSASAPAFPSLSTSQAAPGANTQNTQTGLTNVTASTVGQPAQSPATLPAGHSLPVRLVGLQLPGSPLISMQEGLPAGQTLLSGTVTASANGNTTVQTTQGTLSLPTKQALPIGTNLQLTTLGPPTPISDLPGLSSLLSVERWQALSDAVSLLQAGDYGAAQRLIQLVPQNTPQLGNALLFLFSALRIGSAERWVGKDIIRSLEQIRAGSTTRLGDSIQAAQTRTTDAANQDWKVYHMPFLADSELDELRLYLRDRDAEDQQKDAPDDEDKRFIIETNFSRLGPMQFDGYSRQKQFDLMIRTHSALPDRMRDDIRRLFANVVSALGISGAVGFHVTEKFEISVDDQDGDHRGGVTV